MNQQRLKLSCNGKQNGWINQPLLLLSYQELGVGINANKD